MSSARRPPGIIVRAVVSEARTQAGVAATWARKAGDVLGEIPRKVADAAKVLEDVARQQSSGVSHKHTLSAVSGARRTIEEQLREAYDLLDADMLLIDGYGSDSTAGPVDVGQRSKVFDQAYARRKRASWYNDLLSGRIDPSTSELGPSPGPSPSPGPGPSPGPSPGPGPSSPPSSGRRRPPPTLKDRGGAMPPIGRRRSFIRKVGGAAGALFVGQMLAIPIQGMKTYENYETTLTKLLAMRGTDDMDLTEFVADPDSGGQLLRKAREADADGEKGDIRAFGEQPEDQKVEEWRTLFPTFSERLLLTGQDVVSAMIGLGYHLNRRRATDVGRFSRQYAMDTGRVATFYHTLLKSTGPDLSKDTPAGKGPATAVFGSKRTISGGALDLVRAGIVEAGMSSRPEEYIEDLESDLGAFQQGALFVPTETAVGFRSFMSRAGLSGEAFRSVGAELISGTGDSSDEAMLAAKMSAVKQFMPGGAEMSARKLIELVESGDPSVVGALMKYARMKAKESGGHDGPADERVAMDIFARMTGLSRWKAGAVWSQAKKEGGVVGKPPDPSKGKGPDLWQRGPMVDPQDVTPGEKSPIRHDGPHTFGARSIAKLNADLDLSKYKFGKAFVPFAHELKRAAIIGADGFLKGDGLSSVNDAVNALSDSSQFFLMALGAMSDTAGGEIVSAAIAQNMATDYLRGDPSADLSKLKFKPSLVRPGKPVSDGGGLTSQEVGEIGKSYGASLGETAAVMAIASESSGRGLFGPEGVGIAYTIANRMRKRDKGAWDTVVGDADTTGEQRGRPYSTRRVPGASKFPRILEMFRRAVDKPGEDPTGGATMFFHPTAQKSLHYRDPKRFKSPEEVRKTREGAGLERVNVPGADNIEFHR